jgi:hypothetical protein
MQDQHQQEPGEQDPTFVDINNYISKGLVDTRASMYVLMASMVKELGIRQLISRSKSYKIASRIIT